MIYTKAVNTYEKLSQLQNTVSRELASLLEHISAGLKVNSSNTETVFSNKSKKQIVDMITMATESTGGRWGDKSRRLVVLLTDILVYYRDRDEVVLTPSLYLQYLDLKNLQKLVDFESSIEKHESLLLPLRDFLYSIVRNSKSDEHTNEQFGFITMQLIKNLAYLEAIQVPGSLANRVSIQKSRHMRIAHADYSYTHISYRNLTNLKDDGLMLVYKHIKDSRFSGAVGSIDAQYTVFEDCTLDRAKFHHSSFEWTKFINTSIKRATFIDSKFFDIDFKDLINSESAVFINCRFCLCKMTECKALFIDCDFSDCEKDGLRIINHEEQLEAL